MTTKYRIEPRDKTFVVIHPRGERLVPDYVSIKDAKRDIARRKKEDAMYECAKRLIDRAIKAHMRTHNVDRKTARYWVSSAMDVVD